MCAESDYWLIFRKQHTPHVPAEDDDDIGVDSDEFDDEDDDYPKNVVSLAPTDLPMP
jgi:hypothetical protein